MPDGDIPFGMSFSIRRFYMICKRVEIDTIPACVWGMASTRVIVAVHELCIRDRCDGDGRRIDRAARSGGWHDGGGCGGAFPLRRGCVCVRRRALYGRRSPVSYTHLDVYKRQ